MVSPQKPVGLWPAGDPSGRFQVRDAQFSDVGAVRRLYRGQSVPSRRFYHPYPFDWLRLTALLTYMVATHRIIRWAMRWLPNWAFCLFVLEDTAGAPAGFATIRFVRDDQDPEMWARFGFLVEESRQRQGGGTLLVMALYERAMELGIRRGGGTILAANVASAKVVEQFGFRLHETPEVDRFAPNDQNLADIQDLGPVLERVRRLKEIRVAASAARVSVPVEPSCSTGANGGSSA
jgi:GNAT superfamily N-acetyltransferase